MLTTCHCLPHVFTPSLGAFPAPSIIPGWRLRQHSLLSNLYSAIQQGPARSAQHGPPKPCSARREICQHLGFTVPNHSSHYWKQTRLKPTRNEVSETYVFVFSSRKGIHTAACNLVATWDVYQSGGVVWDAANPRPLQASHLQQNFAALSAWEKRRSALPLSTALEGMWVWSVISL